MANTTLREEFDKLSSVRYCNFHYTELLRFIESKVKEGEARGYERCQKELAQAVEVGMMLD